MLKYQWNIIGNRPVLKSLEQDLANGKLAHAYLFDGTDNIGKYTAAKIFAHIAQCPNDYCHECSVCQEIDKGYHSDTMEIIDNGESIKIETIRETLAKLYMSKQSAYKILLIQNIERMTAEAANAMLKTLEDPPEGVMFLLTTSRVQDTLSTIISRVRTMHFHRLSDQQVREVLEQCFPLAETSMLDLIVTYAVGKPGKAYRLMEDPGLLETYQRRYNDFDLLLKKRDVTGGFAMIQDLVKSSKEEDGSHELQDFLDLFLAMVRQRMIDAHDDREAMARLSTLADKTLHVFDLLKRNVNTRLLLENLMLSL